MRKQVAIAIMGLSVLSTGALASKARLEALGQDANGSMFLDDARNVMLNPATLNYHKDFVTLEWGDTAANTDSASSPQAEGGMFKASGNMVYGLYFGNESNTSNTLRAAAMGGTAVRESNNVDLFVAGDAGVQWGARLTYHSFKDEQAANDVDSGAMRATVGVISGDLEGFLNFGLSNTAEIDNGEEFKGNSSIDLGLTYGQGDVDYMVRVQTIGAEDKDGNEYKAQNVDLGIAKTYKLNDKATAWTSAFYTMDSSENDFTQSSAPGEVKSTYLPVVIGLEVAAKEWLTLRGSVGAEIIGTDENDGGDTKTRADKTIVAAGASLIWGDLSVDGMIGNNDNTGTVPGNNTSAGDGTLRTDTLMSRVSMTYKF